MSVDYSQRDLQGKRFKSKDLHGSDFSGADLRGADFSFADLHGARFKNAKQGIRPRSKVYVFVFALVLSLLSGYIAMLAGTTVQGMVRSTDWRLEASGYILVFFFVIFTGAALWKGLNIAITRVLIALIAITIVLGCTMYLAGVGSGMGAVYGVFVLALMTIMFVIGTVARTTIGTLGSNILFLAIALGGGMFGRSVGGGIGTIVMALACALISKRALKDQTDSYLKRIAVTISSWFGTSFAHADLRNADFSDSEIRNTNFFNANLTDVNWNNTKKHFTLESQTEPLK
jgi:uncharacterized protein YjbI with pentapeptide repeats